MATKKPNTTQEKPAPKKKASKAPPVETKAPEPAKPRKEKLPKIPTTHTESSSKVEPVVLTQDEILIKYQTRDRIEAERDAIAAERESIMATLKGQIKVKDEEIAELTHICRTKVEERNIPTWLHYDLKAGIRYTFENTGKPLNPRKDKRLDTEPMTNEEKRKFSKEVIPLIVVPETEKPHPNVAGIPPAEPLTTNGDGKVVLKDLSQIPPIKEDTRPLDLDSDEEPAGSEEFMPSL